MVQEIDEGIFRIELPLPGNPLRSINSYLVIGEEKNLMIDAGMNRPECIDVMDRELRELDIDLSVTDVFVTHLHADHLGLAPYVSGGKTDVLMGPGDIEDIKESRYWDRMHSFAVRNGFPNPDPKDAISRHPGYKYGPLGPMKIRPAVNGDIIEVGSLKLEVLHTPGHTRGHNCLLERERRLLFSGDHILGDITPNISHWVEEEDPLSDYMRSLRMIWELDIDLALPGHRSMIGGPHARMEELIRHHEERAAEVLDILGSSEMDAFSIASRMTWDMTYRSFDEFPIMQKWFALGEALAHIRYLETGGRVKRSGGSGVLLYHSVPGGPARISLRG